MSPHTPLLLLRATQLRNRTVTLDLLVTMALVAVEVWKREMEAWGPYQPHFASSQVASRCLNWLEAEIWSLRIRVADQMQPLLYGNQAS